MLRYNKPLLFALPAAAAACITLLGRVRTVQAQEATSVVYGCSSIFRFLGSLAAGGRLNLLFDETNEGSKLPLMILSLCNKNLLDLIILGELKTGYAVTKGKVLSWKEGDKVPSEVAALHDVQMMACARDGHCVAVTHTGNPLHWRGDEAPKKMKELEGSRVAAVSGGGRHIAILTKDGDLYTMGANEYGQLGAGDHKSRPDEPVKVAQQVASVACGENHTLYVTKAGKTFGMGANNWCQIGQKEPWETGIAAYKEPEAVLALERKQVASVACGADFSLALTSTGDLYSWGVGRWGQLADGQGRHVKSKPTQVRRAPFGGESRGETSNAQIVCGSDHCLALLTNGELWSWGANAAGQLGTGRLVVEHAPVKVLRDGALKRVFAAANTSAAAEN